MDVEKNEKFHIMRHYQDAFLQMNDAAKEGDYQGYFRLVDHLENLSTLSLDADEFKIIREIRSLIREYTEKVSGAGGNKIATSKIMNRDANARIATEAKIIVSTYIEYPLYRVIERICIDSLKRTVLSAAQGGSHYSEKEDLEHVKTEIEYNLKKFMGVIDEV